MFCKAAAARTPSNNAAAPVPKISYVKLYQPWGWITGAGIYMDDVEAELRGLGFVFLGIAGVATGAAMIYLRFGETLINAFKQLLQL